MSLPIEPNTTCDIYRTGNGPPATPDVAAVPGFLTPDWRRSTQADAGSPWLRWTHVMLIEANVDIRDMYVGGNSGASQDLVWVPDQNGTSFYVVFVERMLRGTPNEYKRVFLDRRLPTWPTNEL